MATNKPASEENIFVYLDISFDSVRGEMKISN